MAAPAVRWPVPTMEPAQAAVAASFQPHGQPRRFAVLGAGFAGVSVAWHLLQYTSSPAPVSVDVYDKMGIGGGASGASGGLLHPYNPKGRLLWKGAEGWTAALRLLAVAEAATSDNSNPQRSMNSDVGSSPLAWRRGILKLARQEKDAITFRKSVESVNDRTKLDWLDGSAVRSLVPGLAFPASDLVLHIPHGINLHPQRYLQALWLACKNFAAKVGEFCPGTQVVLWQEKVTSLRDLVGQYEAVVVCLGAQALLLPELAHKLPLSTCRGVVAELHAPQQSSCGWYSSEAPNLMSSTWMAVQGDGDVLLGATKDWGSTDASSNVSGEERRDALGKLLGQTAPFYPSISEWEVKGLRAGLRAMPPRTPLGSIPLVGCIDDLVKQGPGSTAFEQRNDGSSWRPVETKVWLFGGLGSRGLIHHGWLGESLAKAVIFRDESLLSSELRQW